MSVQHLYSAAAQGEICQCDSAVCAGFRKWRETGRSVARLQQFPHADAQGITGPGMIYDGPLFIEQCGPRSYCLTLGNDTSVDSLLAQEWKLYNWAIKEGYAL